MSEVQKPTEEVVAPSAPTETPVPAPAVENKSADVVEPSTDAPAASELAKEEEVAAPVKEEPKPVEEGILGYKGPGLLKGLIFQKKFFWFGSEPVEHKNLASYLRGEKPEVANGTAAWASHTGKGLLFFSKKASEKATPAHVFNLAEVTDITEDGTVAFFFNLAGHKYTFEAATLLERDGWVKALKAKSAEANELSGSVTESEGYKSTLASLAKPVAVPSSSSPKKSTDVKKEEVHESKDAETAAKTDKPEEKAEKSRKDRSQSRKRSSIFGAFMAKKEEPKKDEVKEESTPAVAQEPVATEESATPAAPAVEESAPAAAPAIESSTPVATEQPAEKPAPSKRNSIFGSFAKFGTKEKKAEATEAAAPVSATTDQTTTPVVADSAPIIPKPEAQTPLETAVASPATVPAETSEAPAANDEVKADAPVVKSDKRKSSLPWLSKKEKPTSDDEGEKKPLSPFAKLRATVKSKTSSPKAAEKVEKSEPEPSKDEATPAPVATEEIKSEPEPVAPTATPQVAATA